MSIGVGSTSGEPFALAVVSMNVSIRRRYHRSQCASLAARQIDVASATISELPYQVRYYLWNATEICSLPRRASPIGVPPTVATASSSTQAVPLSVRTYIKLTAHCLWLPSSLRWAATPTVRIQI